MRLPPQSQPPGRLSTLAHWSRAMLAVHASFLGASAAFAAPSTTVVISQVYGGGGNSGATFTNDFVELHNISTASVSLAGWSLQYAASTGVFSSGDTTALSGSIRPGGYFLVRLASTAAVGAALPTSDFTGGLSLAVSGGKIALVNSVTALVAGDFTLTSPTGPSIVDFVGYGTSANAYEGTGRTAAPSASLAVFRGNSGTTDTDQNGSDFTTALPAPRNSATPVFPADTVAPLLAVSNPFVPADDALSVGIAAPLSITFNEPIFKGTGNIAVYLSTGGAPVFNIDVTTSAVTTSGLTATIALPGVLTGSTAYYVNVPSGVFKDGANNLFGGISGTTAWSFTTAVVDNNPPVATLSPLTGTTGLSPSSNLAITYNEAILIGSGTILLKTGNTTVESISVPGPRVALSGVTLTIDPTSPLNFSNGYSVEVPAGVVTDQALNLSTAIVAGAWTFTTLAQPSVIISQYYEGAGSSRYIELQNLTGASVSLNDYRLTVWSNSDPAGNQGWKSGAATTPRVTPLTGKSIPPNGFFLVADSGAATPEHAVVNNDLVVNNSSNPGATAFSGSQSVVLYSGASNDLASISDAVSFVNDDGVDKTFYRLNDAIGFDFSLGSSILNYASTWVSNKTLADVASASPADAWYLRASNLPQILGLTINPASFPEGAVGTAATATVTRTGSTAAELDVAITVSDVGEVSTDEFVTFPAGESGATVTFSLLAVNDLYLDGPQNVTISVQATGFLSASQQVTVADELTDVAFPVVINEVDSDQADLPNDANEFIELYNNSASPVSLNDTVLVLYNGNGSVSYRTIDLSGFPDIPGRGYFVVGNAAVANVNVTFLDNTLQNGGDAVALYLGSPGMFPNGTAATTTLGTRIDAVVYNNGQTDAAALVTALTPGKAQVNESAASTPVNSGQVNSISRYPDGGTPFETTLYAAALPTPGATNMSFSGWASVNVGGQGPTLDFDNDGMENGVEYFFGESGSTFTANPQPNAAGLISFPHPVVTPGATYLVKTSPDLVTWSPVTTRESGGFVNYMIPPGEGKIFVRLEVVMGP